MFESQKIVDNNKKKDMKLNAKNNLPKKTKAHTNKFQINNFNK